MFERHKSRRTDDRLDAGRERGQVEGCGQGGAKLGENRTWV
jgi:hypothetical protein